MIGDKNIMHNYLILRKAVREQSLAKPSLLNSGKGK